MGIDLNIRHKTRIKVMKKRFLRNIENKTRRYIISNETPRQNVRIKSIKGKMIERQLRWFRYMRRMSENRLTKALYET